jgi:hypothetical protein
MKPLLFSATCAIAAATPALAQPSEPLEVPEIPNPNRFSLGARVSLNLTGDFTTSRTSPGAASGGGNHIYDDGYVRVDSSDNAGGLTWNWGYERAPQVVGDTLEFHSIQSAEKESADEAQYGMELIYERLLGRFFSRGVWGLEVGFSYTDLDLRADRGSGSGASLITDSFPLNGVLPPNAPYHGTFNGPGPLLGDTPTRTIATDTASLASDHRLSGHLFGFRFGPVVEWNFTRAISIALSGGIALAPAIIDYDFSESIALQGGQTFATRGHSSKTDLLYGHYINALLRYNFNDHWSLYGGGQFQTLNDLEQTIGTRTARLDAGSTLHGVLGVSWRF